jgi:hypothetical protein
MEKILNLNNNIVSYVLDKDENESNKNEESFKTKMPKMNPVSMIILVVLSIVTTILYTYGVYLAFFCSKNLINLLTNLMASLLVPHLHLIYRLARPCNEMVWLTKRTAIILTVILLVVIPIIMLLLPKNIKLYVALLLGGNTIVGSAYNYSLWGLLMIPFILLMTTLLAF